MSLCSDSPVLEEHLQAWRAMQLWLWSLVVSPEKWSGLLCSHLTGHNHQLWVTLSPVLIYLHAPAGRCFPPRALQQAGGEGLGRGKWLGELGGGRMGDLGRDT